MWFDLTIYRTSDMAFINPNLTILSFYSYKHYLSSILFSEFYLSFYATLKSFRNNAK